MRPSNLRRHALPAAGKALVLAVVTAFGQPVGAATVCSATMDDFSFGSIPLTSASQLTGTVTVTCRTDGALLGQNVRVNYCLDIGDGSGGAGPSLSPRWLRNGANETMAMDLAHDATYLTPVGSSSSPSTVPINGTMSYSTPALQNATFSTNHVIHARIPAQPNLAIGSYQTSFDGIHTALVYRYDTGFPPTMPASCASGGTAGAPGARASFTASATVQPECHFDAVDLLDFGEIPGLPGSAVTASAAITMTCRRGTDWQLSLDDGLHAVGQTRRMSNGNGAYAQYELYRDVAMTQRFGQTVNVDRQTGTGTGGSQTVMVHGRMPAAQNLTPGSYGDRVVVTVTY